MRRTRLRVHHAIRQRVLLEKRYTYPTRYGIRSAPGLGPPLPHLRQDWAHPSDTIALRELLARIVVGQVGGSLQVEPKWGWLSPQEHLSGISAGRFQGAAKPDSGI